MKKKAPPFMKPDTDDKKPAFPAKKKAGGKGIPPAFKNNPGTPMNGKKSKASAGTGSKMCPACIKSNASSCSHM